jgi:hypothetical protein
MYKDEEQTTRCNNARATKPSAAKQEEKSRISLAKKKLTNTRRMCERVLVRAGIRSRAVRRRPVETSSKRIWRRSEMKAIVAQPSDREPSVILLYGDVVAEASSVVDMRGCLGRGSWSMPVRDQDAIR